MTEAFLLGRGLLLNDDGFLEHLCDTIHEVLPLLLGDRCHPVIATGEQKLGHELHLLFADSRNFFVVFLLLLKFVEPLGKDYLVFLGL